MFFHQLITEDRRDVFGSLGVGSTGHNRNIDYEGIRVFMSPRTFFDLVTKIPEYTSVDFIKEKIQNGEAVAAPYLIIGTPDGWKEGDFSGIPHVRSHEGRNRMRAVEELYGEDTEVEVHLIDYSLRNKHYTDQHLRHLNKGVQRENSHSIHYGAWFFV